MKKLLTPRNLVVIIPDHKKLAQGTLRSILRQAGISFGEFVSSRKRYLKKKKSELGVIDSSSSMCILLHRLDPFEDGFAQLLDATLLVVHGARLPVVCGLEVPVGHRAATRLLVVPDHLYRHAKLSIPGVQAAELVGDSHVSAINDSKYEDESYAPDGFEMKITHPVKLLLILTKFRKAL